MRGRRCAVGGGARYILFERSDKGGAYTRVLWYNIEYKKQSPVYIMIGNNFNFIDSPRDEKVLFRFFFLRPLQNKKTFRRYNIIIYFITIGVFSPALRISTVIRTMCELLLRTPIVRVTINSAINHVGLNNSYINV